MVDDKIIDKFWCLAIIRYLYLFIRILIIYLSQEKIFYL